MIKGNAVQPENLEKLNIARQKLSDIKLAKLVARQNKHPESEVWNFYGFEQHLKSEYAEFTEGWANRDTDNMLEELADMSNIIDMLVALILVKDETLFQVYPPKKEQHDDAY